MTLCIGTTQGSSVFNTMVEWDWDSRICITLFDAAADRPRPRGAGGARQQRVYRETDVSRVRRRVARPPWQRRETRLRIIVAVR